MRQYQLRRSAIEIFLLSQTNFFLNFPNGERNAVYKKIVSLDPPKLAFTGGTPEETFKNADLVKRWQRREISNFDYLMQLNTIAGRTFNDFAQYPVFPWSKFQCVFIEMKLTILEVITDYTSETIDLNDPSIYRDLSKPIGALNPERLQQFIERYERLAQT